MAEEKFEVIKTEEHNNEESNVFYQLPKEVISLISSHLPLESENNDTSVHDKKRRRFSLGGTDQPDLKRFHFVESENSENNDTSGQENRRRTSQTNFSLAANRFHSITRNYHFALKLMELIDAGKQTDAQVLLKKYPALAMESVRVTDEAGRTFNCSPFQYALWILDVNDTCHMMLDCLPQNEEGEVIRKNLNLQAQSVKVNGLEYEFKGKRYKEKHFSFELIETAVNELINNSEEWSLEELTLVWSNIVGQANLLIPMHMLLLFTKEGFFCLKESTKSAEEAGLGNDFVITSIKSLLEKYQQCICDVNARKEKGDEALSIEQQSMTGEDLLAMQAFEVVRSKINLSGLFERLATPFVPAHPLLPIPGADRVGP